MYSFGLQSEVELKIFDSEVYDRGSNIQDPVHGLFFILWLNQPSSDSIYWDANRASRRGSVEGLQMALTAFEVLNAYQILRALAFERVWSPLCSCRLPDGFTQLLNLTQLFLNDAFLEYLPANFGR